MAVLNRLLGLGGRAALLAEAAVGRQRLSILIFHRVLAAPEALYPGGPDAAQFDQWMTRVARSFNVIGLAEAAGRLAQRALPPRALVITFDDGYADNAEVALPILLRHGLRATFFVSTGFLDGGCMWNDQVIHCLRETTQEHLDLSELGLGSLAMSTAAQREQAIDVTLKRVKYMPLAERELALASLCRVTQIDSTPLHLMMRSEQVQLLHRHGMEIGGHTVHHPILTELPAAEARDEIQRGRTHLQNLVDAPVDVFAYPNGRPGQDYAAEHVNMVRQAGFTAAVSTAPGVATAGADVFQLPRATPWDQDPDRWMARLVAGRTPRRFDAVT